MGDVTPNFSKHEMTLSKAAAAAYGFSETPYPEEWVETRLRPLFLVLEKLRARLGGRRVMIIAHSLYCSSAILPRWSGQGKVAVTGRTTRLPPRYGIAGGAQHVSLHPAWSVPSRAVRSRAEEEVAMPMRLEGSCRCGEVRFAGPPGVNPVCELKRGALACRVRKRP